MRKGQIFAVDLMLALVIIVLSLGIISQTWDYHLQQTTSTVEYAKMQQIAIDAAAVKYYNGAFLNLDNSALSLGYSIDIVDDSSKTCITSIRGTGGTGQVGVFVCRGE